ncbi:hypothetical protein JCM8202_002920 [Rhodotorula sphaerocarpa]
MPRPASAVADPDTVLAPTYPDHDQATDAPTHAEHEGMDAAVADDDEQLEEDEHDAEQELYESSSSPSTETDTLTWINWFCSLPGHEYFCEVAEDFIEDDFNLTGLLQLVPFYKEAMEMILDVEAEEDEVHRVPDVSIVESSAELLYGLIHQRYILTRQGLQQMYAKFEASHFGTCPRVYCAQCKLVPCGRSDLPGVDTVKLFCPSCLDMYVPPSSRFQGVDGAFFGTTFPHMLFQTYPPPSTLPLALPAPADPSRREPTTPLTSLSKVYVPRIYGFKVSERARSGPRMQWMRMRPRTEGEIDWTDENGVPMHAVDPQDGSGAGGPGTGGEGKLFEDDLEEEDDAEEEEEEEGAGGAAGGAAAGAGAGAGGAGKTATGGDPMVEQASSPQQQLRGQTPAAAARREIRPLPRGGPPRTAPAAMAAAVEPTSAATSTTASTSTSTRSPLPPTASAASLAASSALAASIQRHLAHASAATGAGSEGVGLGAGRGFDLPRRPAPVAVAGAGEKRQTARV